MLSIVKKIDVIPTELGFEAFDVVRIAMILCAFYIGNTMFSRVPEGISFTNEELRLAVLGVAVYAIGFGMIIKILARVFRACLFPPKR